MEFEWNETKRLANMNKHGVDFRQALTAFADPNRILEVTSGKAGGKESRYRCIGYDGVGIVTVNFTLRGGRIRLVNAGYWRKGKRDYEKNHLHR